MKKILYGFLALASVVMVSCSQEYDEQITANTDQVKKVFTASTEENSTRTSIAVEQETGNYVVIWNGEEMIAVNGVDYKVIEGAGTKNVKFGANVEGEEAATAEVYNAVYPSNAWVEGGLNLEHLKEQTAANATFGHGYAVTVSTTTKNKMDFKFKNALSFLRVRFTLAEDAKEEAITIKTVKITANDYLWGTVSDVNYSTGVIGAVANESEAGKTIVYTAGEDVVLTKDNMFEAVIAVPVNEEGRTLTIDIEGENAWTGNRYTYKAENVTKKYLRNNVTTLAKAIKPIEVIYVAEGVTKVAENTFEIAGIKGLEWVRNQVETGENTFKGQTLVMTEDVDLASIADWTPLSYENFFEGTFDGNNKTISNLTIAQEDNYYLGFFGVAKNATFKNIVFHNASVSNTNGVLANASGGHFAILCGYTAGTTTIDNVTVTGSVKLQGETAHAGGQRIGTMIGVSNGVANITNVTINAEEGSFVNGYSFVGGVVGQGLGKVVAENVHSNLNVQGVQFAAGGLAGCAEKGSTFTNCSASGNVALVGARPLATTVNDVVRIGGIVGTYSGDDRQSVIVTLSGCTYTGTLSSKTTADEVATAFDFRGLVGRAYNAGAGTVGSKIVIDGVEFTDCGSGVYLVEGAYEIGSVAALKWLANEVNVNKNSFAGKTVKLVGDIDLGGAAWTPIGNATTSFNGTFDGQEHTISNLVSLNEGVSNIGLFGVTKDGEIKNLTVENAKVSGRLNVAVVAGTPYTSKYTNITVKGHIEVNGLAYIGGVGGKNAYANWTDITVEADEDSYVKAYSIENGNAYRTYVGGVIGFMGEGGHKLENVTSNIDVIGSTCDVGGIAGIIHYGNSFINCSSSGDIEITDAEDYAEAEEIGGIAGVWMNNTENVIINNCTFTGTLKTNITEGVNLLNNTIVGAPYGAVTSNQLIIDGVVWKEDVYVAAVGDIKYTSLAEAVAAANGKTVKLIENVTLEETLVIAKGAEVTLDLNGKTISQEKACTASYTMISNKGTLTIDDSSAEKNGAIVFTDLGDGDASFGWGSYTLRNEGTLTVNAGTIKNATRAMSHCTVPLMLYAGKTTINGGAIVSANYRSIQGFATPEVIINGGAFEGQVWMHVTCNATASLTINGGTFEPRGNDGSSVFLNNTNDIKLAINGGYFKTKVGCDDKTKAGVVGAVKGGFFTEAAKTGGATAALVAEGYSWVESGDANFPWTITEFTPVASVGGVEYETIEEALEAAKEIGGNVTVSVVAGTYDSFPAAKLAEGMTLECAPGTVFEGAASLNVGGATVKGATFSNEGGVVVEGTVNGDFEDCVFTGNSAHRWCYLPANSEIVYTNCVFEGATAYAVHFDAGSGSKIIFNNCEFYGFNALPSTIDVEYNGCFFGHKEGTANYNGVNLWGNTVMNDTKFDWSTDCGNEWIQPKSSDKSYTFTNVTINYNGSYEAMKPTDIEVLDDMTFPAVTIDGVVYQGVADGVILANGVYEIGKTAGLQWFASAVNGGNSFAGKTVKLVNNIDLSSIANWTPIGTGSAAPHFQGTFDGNGKTISGLTIKERHNGTPQAALFGSAAGTVTFKDLVIDGANIVYPKDGSDFYGAALVGTYYGTITVQNVTVQNSYISGNNKVAGLLAHDGSSSKLLVDGCKVLNSTIESTDAADGGNVGGVIGLFQQSTSGVENIIKNTTVKGCTINGINSSNSGKRGNGLIVGSVIMKKENTVLKLENCTVEGNTFVNGATSYVSPYGDGTLVGGYREGSGYYMGQVYIDGVLCVEKEPVATVNGVEYADMVEAFAAVENGGTITLVADAEVAQDATVTLKNKSFTLDLAGKTLSGDNTRTATHNALFDVNSGAVMTVKNGTIEYTHTGSNMGWNGATTVINVTAGGVLNLEGVKVVNNGGTDMNFAMHLNNWGEVTVTANNCVFDAPYCGFRVFNSGFDMNNVTITNSTLKGNNRAFWVHNYIGDLDKSKHSDEAVKARLNLNIFGNGNTFVLASEAISPIRFGFNSTVYFDPETGNEFITTEAQLRAFAEAVNSGADNFAGKTVVLGADITLTQPWTPVGQTGATQFAGTFDGNGKTISNLTINAPESYSGNYATGMFGWVETAAVIKNVVLSGATINGYHYVGGIAGYTSSSAKIENCEVVGSTITADPNKKDTAGDYNGDKVGGIVGFTNGNNVISGNKVSNTTIEGYRHIGGIVGYLYGTAENNSISGVTINVNNTNNYKKYDIQSKYGVNSIAGVMSGTSNNNTGSATINWGEILEHEPYRVYVMAQPKSSYASWTKVNLYTWYKEGGKDVAAVEWAGTDVSSNTAVINGYTYHYYEYPAAFNGKDVYVIANNGSLQTADIHLGTLDKDYYVVYSAAIADVYTTAPAAGSVEEYKEPEVANMYYLKPNSNWTQASARFVGYFWNGSGSVWVELTDADKDGYYECDLKEFVPTKVIFLRKNPTGFVYNNWDCWNRVGDLTISAGKNCYTMKAGDWTQENSSGYTGGTWSKK